jgi:hypothetical protein
MNLPAVAVEVEEASRVHEAVVLRVVVVLAVRGRRGICDRVGLVRTGHAEAEERQTAWVVGSAIGGLKHSANFSCVSSIAKALKGAPRVSVG